MSTGVAGLVAACGGGGGGDPGPQGPVAGVMAPVQQGLTFIEYDAEGKELQRSTATDAAGAFVFQRALRGVRVQAQSDEPSYRAVTYRSARIVPGNRPLQVSAATTLFDQWLASGAPETEARRRLNEQLAAACGAPAAAAAAAAYWGQDAAMAAPARGFLQSLTAYVAALRDVGLAPTLPGNEWLAKFAAHTDVLHQMCSIAATMQSAAWISETQARIAHDLELPAGTELGALDQLRPQVLDQVLQLMGRQLPMLEFHELAAAPAMDIAVVGPEAALKLAVDVLRLRYQRQRLLTVGQALAAEHVIDRHGHIQQELTARLLANQSDSVLRISNQGADDQPLRMSVNGAALGDMSDVVSGILSAPAQRPGESLQARAWLYLKSRSRHAWPITSGRAIHQPDLYLRSLGLGFCDDAASVLHFIWQQLGFQARVWALDGHVVPEVAVAGRWEMYDADLGPYFLNRQGQVAGVVELAADTALITAPLLNMPSSSDKTEWSVVADLFGSTGNNFVEPWYAGEFADPLKADFVIPAGAYLEAGPALRYEMPTIEPTTKAITGAMRLWLPPGYKGSLPLPLLLADAQGDATVRFDGAEWQRGRAGLNGDVEVTATGLAGRVATYFNDTNSPDIGLARIHVSRVGPGGLTLVLLVNPKYLQSPGDFVLSVQAGNLDGYTVAASQLAR